MKKLLFAITAILSLGVSAQYNQSLDCFNSSTSSKKRPNDYEHLSAPDSLGNRIQLKMPKILQKSLSAAEIPYPIIFIHGLNSYSKTWDNTTDWMDLQYGLTYGGRMDYCLNFDDNDRYANTYFYPFPGADIAAFSSTLINGDYYYLNFDVGYNGSFHPDWTSFDYVHSDQAAITKQGNALKDAINKVLTKTGKQKVIIFGHSMGGLAAREYLQNPALWQSDGEHHVAKLITTGTPHGGSNSTGFGTEFLLGFDKKSEAIRDLRHYYRFSEEDGVYLYGGLELQDGSMHMNDNITLDGIDFHNVDVNCNGITGEIITGLNQKSIPTNLDYACIIGRCWDCLSGSIFGDGVVGDFQAHLTNYYNLNVNPVFNTFYYNKSGTIEIHGKLTEQNYENMQGLDEPNELELAYGIEVNKTYKGFNTIQPTGGYINDIDYYKFSVSTRSNINVVINDINLSNLKACIVDGSYNIVGDIFSSNGLSSINYTQELNPGNYYFRIFGEPNSTSYLHPYLFRLNQEVIITNVTSEVNSSTIHVFPNPTNNYINIQGVINETAVRIYDLNGKTLINIEIVKDQTIDVSYLKSGLYTIEVATEGKKTTKKVVIN